MQIVPDPVGDAVRAVRAAADDEPPDDAPVYDLYLRVSSPGQDRPKDEYGRAIKAEPARPRTAAERQKEVKRSLDTQEILLRMEARARGVRVGRVHRDTHTATEFFERPALQDVHRRMAEGACQGVLILKVERFSRKQGFLSQMQNLCQRYDVALVFAQNPMVDGSPVGRFLGTALEFAAEVALESLKEQFARAKQARLDAGRPLHGSKPRYGCRWGDPARTHYVWVEAEVAVVRWLFAAFLEGRSLRGLVADLEARGVASPKGRAVWAPKTIRNILADPIYAGRPVGNRWRREWYRPAPAASGADPLAPAPRKRWRAVERPASEQTALPPVAWADGREQAPITAEDFGRAQELLAGLRREHPGGRPAPEAEGWLLRGGYARCATCGGPLYVVRRAGGRGRRPPLYRCGANAAGPGRCAAPVSITKPRLEREVWLRLIRVLSAPGVLTEAVRRYRARAALTPEARGLTEAEGAAARTAAADAERRIANLTRQLSGADDPETEGPLRHELAIHVRALRAAREQAAAAGAKLERAARAEAELLAFEPVARRLAARLAAPTPRTARRVIELLRPAITVPPAGPGRGPVAAEAIRVEVEDGLVARAAALERALTAEDAAGAPGGGGGREPGPTGTGRSRFVPLPTGALRLRLLPDGSVRAA